MRTGPRIGGPTSRRQFLGGGAVVVGLPFLESLVPRPARAQAAGARRRVIYWWMPNGFWMDSFRPTTTATAYQTTTILMPLYALRSEFSVITVRENTPAAPER